jgi:hypothetical protein
MSRLGSPGAALLAAMLMFACSSDDGDSGPRTVTFTNDIHPILQMKCGGSGSGCHGVDQAPIQPGHGAADVAAAYEATQEVGRMDELVYERILARITSETASMPPDYANPPCSGMIGAPGCITEAELALIQEWIAQGTPL